MSSFWRPDAELSHSERPLHTKSKSAPLSPEAIDDLKKNENSEWEHHPRNPLNWTSWKRWSVIVVISLYMFVTVLESSVMAPALPDISRHFSINDQTVVVLTLSIYLLSFAIAPLLYAPLSEMYGRFLVVQINMVLFLGFNIGCVFAPTTGALIALRFLSGWVGSVPLALGGAIIGDLFPPAGRGLAMAVFTMGGMIAPVAGPIAGGFLTETSGFKYIFVLLVCLSGVFLLISIPLFRETYGPVILARSFRTPKDLENTSMALNRRESIQNVWINVKRPFVLLARSFICFILSLYMATYAGIWYLMFTTFPGNSYKCVVSVLFTDIYHFNTGTVGLAYIGLSIGFVLATFVVAGVGDRVFTELVRRNGGKSAPEMRIPLLIVGSFFVPIGLFWYGWSIEAKIHWIMPILGTGIFGFGIALGIQFSQLYLIDAFGIYAASALSAAAVLRSMLAFAFPLFGSQLYETLGNGGGNSLLAGISIVLGIPFPILIWYKGDAIRKRNPLDL
ncbi:MFS general substrate transporter [Stereum hirsutum FP-91666 SS1]|uniref:MFS general substrate transporter n=1 Tax=Stereum hirsutum (strain FP-91666) TaxID=721885 RepID=UPI000444A556|nr:MFS general substrate transporter [Stereum hirsutum FP-91666 SS1]EIM81804.1 MFS general substrate transporter [Stereum hirsutum FP-91666 SS1]